MAGHWISAPAQVQSIAKAVAAAFAASALTAEEKSPGKIEITDLPWAAPPLVSTVMLGGAPLQDYLGVPMALEEDTLFRFWTETLEQMWYRPSRVMKRGTYANCGWAMPKVKLGQRALLFSQPVGFPSHLDELSGALFSIEVAHAAATSLPVHDVVSDENNYYADLANGRRIGIVDGRPACESNWNMSVAGQVPDLLTMTRGEADYHCLFDQIASLRSVLNVHRKRFPHNFEALEYALQALRLLTLGGHCPELVSEMRLQPLDMAAVRRKERALRDAIEVLDVEMSDRSKLQVWHSLLVPEVLSPAGFKKNIFSGPQYPFSLAANKLSAIRTWLDQEYETQIPVELRQLSRE